MMQPETTCCIVKGLTSERGRKLNGSFGTARIAPSRAFSSKQQQQQQQQQRIPVWIDGQAEPISIKLDNLHFLNPNQLDHCQIAAGRSSFRIQQLNGIVVNTVTGEIRRHQVFEREHFGRAKVNLMVLSIVIQELQVEFLAMGREHHHRLALYTPTDLNVARALQRAVTSTTLDNNNNNNNNNSIHLGAGLDSILQETIQRIRNLQQKQEWKCAFHFASSRIDPDNQWNVISRGEQRVQAVQQGCYKIYPCPHEDYLDAHEVRYAAPINNNNGINNNNNNNPTMITVMQESYLEYGEQEAIDYVQNTVALHETERLSPLTLAKIDPQAFWSAVLHLDKFLQTCQSLSVDKSILQEWDALVEGSTKSQTYWKKTIQVPSLSASASSSSLSPSVQGTKWGIGDSEARHKTLSKEYAIKALYAVLDGIADCYQGATVEIDRSNHMMYHGTEIGRFLDAFASAKQKEQELLRENNNNNNNNNNNASDPALIYRLWNRALSSHGFGQDILDTTSPDPMLACGGCGSAELNKLKECAKCRGAVYCSRDCQTKAWKKHKKVCSVVMAQVNRCMRNLRMKHELDDISTASSYKPGTMESYTEPSIISETSSTGTVGIMINPGSKSFLVFNELTPDLSQVLENVDDTTLAKNTLIFEALNELPTLERFLLSCGPLGDIQVAQASLDKALECVGGNLEDLRIRAAGFTALEWAAKKGNSEIVEWLCTDHRTQGLVHIGSPVGWACYTGQVGICKTLASHGANPSATHTILWADTHPMFAAAQNGQLEALEWLVDDLGQDIHMIDRHGRGILDHIKVPPNWNELDGHKKCLAWANQKLNCAKNS